MSLPEAAARVATGYVCLVSAAGYENCYFIIIMNF